jgi:hypothetical protein
MSWLPCPAMSWFRKPRHERFAAEVLAAVRARPHVRSATYDPEQFAIECHRTSGASGWIFLHNTFHETEGASRAERRERIDRLVAFTLDAGSTATLGWDEVRPLLRPTLRGVSFAQGTSFGLAPTLSRPALPYLAEYAVIDRPTSMSYVTSERPETWGVTPTDVFAAARANLAQIARFPAPAGERDRSVGPALIRFVDTGDAYFPSWLLVEGFLAGMASRVGGRPVAFVPDTSTLLVTADEPEAMPQLLAVVEAEYSDAVRQLSPVAYTCDDAGAVIPYRTHESIELADRLHRAELLLCAREYANQRSALEAQHGRDGTDVYVGGQLVVERRDGSRFSLAVWPPDCHTLLAEADYVDFAGEEESFRVPWVIVAAQAQLRPEPGFAPPRYRVTAWPAEPVLDQLRAEAVQL